MEPKTFKEYLKNKKDWILIWFCFHGFALFANTFKIRGNIGGSTNLLTSHTNRDDTDFWPFVNFNSIWQESRSTGFFGDRTETVEMHGFNGFFYKYGIAEFIFYVAIIFIALYVRWRWNSIDVSSNQNKQI